MFKKKKKVSQDKYILTFTKKWVGRILWFGCIWITWSYILATLGKDSIAESLSQTVAKIIISTMLGYILKAFFETYSEKHNELKEKGLSKDLNNIDNIDETNDDYYED